MEAIPISVDVGTSATKIICEATAYEPYFLLMEPEVRQVSNSSLDRHLSAAVGTPLPQDDAWLEWDGNFYAVGYLARSLFESEVDLDSSKYEPAIPKILAAVGTIAEREQLPDEFDLYLATLLPYGEWDQRDLLETRLRAALTDFSFRGRSLSVELAHFNCKPEGSGMTLARLERLQERAREMRLLTVMAGHRDLSLLTFERGCLVEGLTHSHLGLSWMLRKASERYPFQSKSLLNVVFAAKDKLKPRACRALASSRDASAKTKESKLIVDVLTSARDEYLARVREWLGDRLKIQPDEAIVGGGTALYLADELQSLLAPIPIAWSGGLVEDVREAFHLNGNDRAALSTRLADVYGLSRSLHKQFKRIQEISSW